MASTAKKPAKEKRAALEETDDAAISPPIRAMSKIPKHPQCIDILGHKYFYKLSEGGCGDSPQALAFTDGDGSGHMCYVRAEMLSWARSRGFLFTSFRDNNAFIAHVKSRYLSESGSLSEAFYELIRDHKPDLRITCTRIYIDAEWYAPLDKFESAAERDIAAEDRLVHILQTLSDILQTAFGCTVMPRFAITEGGREKNGVYKHSMHIIVTNVYAATNRDKRVVEMLSSALSVDGTHDNGEGGHVIDSSVYSRNRHFRIVRSPKEKGGRPLEPYVFLDDTKGALFSLAFTGPADRDWVDGGFAYEMKNTLVSWPAKSVDELGDGVFQLKGYVDTDVPKGHKRTEKPMCDTTYPLGDIEGAPPALAAAKETTPAKTIRILVHEDLDKMAKSLAELVTQSEFCVSLGWRRSALLEYISEADDFSLVRFALIFSDGKGHMCPKKVEHSGSSNRRIFLNVSPATGNVFAQCFASRTAKGDCLKPSKIGTIDVEGGLPEKVQENAAIRKEKGKRRASAVTWM